MTTTHTIANITLTTAAYEALREVGMDNAETVEIDLDTLRGNAEELGMEKARALLLGDCCAAADEDRLAGWRDYVSALVSAAEAGGA